MGSGVGEGTIGCPTTSDERTVLHVRISAWKCIRKIRQFECVCIHVSTLAKSGALSCETAIRAELETHELKGKPARGYGTYVESGMRCESEAFHAICYAPIRGLEAGKIPAPLQSPRKHIPHGEACQWRRHARFLGLWRTNLVVAQLQLKDRVVWRRMHVGALWQQ